MNKISAAAIDAAIEQLEDLEDEQYEKHMEAFAEAQPVLFAYLFSEQFDVLSEEERGFLHYLALIAWRAIEHGNGGRTEAVAEELIGEAEEANYERLENAPGRTFAERLDIFFDDTYAQPDLLDFAAEAALEEEEEGEEALISEEGREPIFVALKTVIDVLTRQ